MDLFRLAQRARDARSLSQFERAPVEGARVMFSQLAQACQDILQSTNADSAVAHSTSTPSAPADGGGAYVPEREPRTDRKNGDHRGFAQV